MPVVRIKTAGCDIYPHGTFWNVLDLKDGVYPTLNESDRIPAEWCEETTNDDPRRQDIPIFGKKTMVEKNFDKLAIAFTLNDFRRYGYFVSGDVSVRTDFFKVEEYEEFEKYMKDNNLKFE